MKKIFYILLSLGLISATCSIFVINFIAEQSVVHVINKVNEEKFATLDYSDLDCNILTRSITMTDINLNFNDTDWRIKETSINGYDFFNLPPHSLQINIEDFEVPMTVFPAKDKIILAAHGIAPINVNLKINNQYDSGTLVYDLTVQLAIDKMMSYDISLSLGNMTEKNYLDVTESIANQDSPLVTFSKVANATLKSIKLQFTNQEGLEIISKMNGVTISTEDKRAQLAQKIEQTIDTIEQSVKSDLQPSQYSDFSRVAHDLKKIINSSNKFTISFEPKNKSITELSSTFMALQQQNNSDSILRINQLCKFISLTY